MKLFEQKLITSIIPKGAGRRVLQGLRREHGINTGNINMARGVGMSNPLFTRGLGEQTEKEILTVVVSAEQADEIFDFIFDLADIGEPHHGIIFQSTLLCSSAYDLPQGLAEESE